MSTQTTAAAVHHVGTSEHGYRLAADLNGEAPGPDWRATTDPAGAAWIEIPHDVAERVRALAVATAATWAQEYPGEALDPSETDWDATAWDTDKAEIDRDTRLDLLSDAGCDVLWSLYDEVLVAETERLAAA